MDYESVDLAGVDGVVFDFGGVISLAPGNDAPIYAVGGKWGLDCAAYDDAFKKYRHLWDGGEIDGAEMYRRILEDRGFYNVSAADLEILWRADAEGWVKRMRKETLPFMRKLKAEGYKIGILTNMAADFFREYFSVRCAEHIALADALVVSAHEHLVKPDPAIYRLMEKRLDLAPEKLMFFDDLAANVAAARSCGWLAAQVI